MTLYLSDRVVVKDMAFVTTLLIVDDMDPVVSMANTTSA